MTPFCLWELARDIEASGPVRGDWPNYFKLNQTRHHWKTGPTQLRKYFTSI
jgi:hypothetical protein